jgi:autotransporter-associated beta strand protein
LAGQNLPLMTANFTGTLSGSTNPQPTVSVTMTTTGNPAVGTIIANGATLQLNGGLANLGSVGFNSSADFNNNGIQARVALSGSGVGGLGAIQNLTSSSNTTGSNTFNGPFLLTGPTVIGGQVGNIALFGEISGAADITKVGNDSMLLMAPSTFTGEFTIAGGFAQAQVYTNSLGSDAGGTQVLNGASLYLGSGYEGVGEPLILNGDGFGIEGVGDQIITDSRNNLTGVRGALVENYDVWVQGSFSPGNEWFGDIVLGSNTTIKAMSYGGSQGFNGGVVLGNAYGLQIYGNVTDNGGGFGVTKVGAGALTYWGGSTYSGATTVTDGTLVAGGEGIIQNTTISVQNQAAFTIDDTAVDIPNRYTGTLNLYGGTFNVIGNNTGGVTTINNMGAINLQGGLSTISMQVGTASGDGNLVVSSALNRSVGATVNISGTSASTAVTNPGVGTVHNKLSFTSAPALTGGILPYASVATPLLTAFNFATYGGTGIASAISNVTDTFVGVDATSNVVIDANTALPGNVTVNSVLVLGAPTLNLVGGGSNFTMSVASGGIITANGAGTLNGGTVDFGNAEGIVLGNNSLTINSTLDGNSGVTYAATGTITLQGIPPTQVNGNVNGNTYAGTTTQDAGTLLLGSVSSLSSGPYNWIFGGLGTLVTTTNFAINNAINLNNSIIQTGLNARMALNGPMTVTGVNTFANTPGSNTTGIIINSTITGTGEIDYCFSNNAFIVVTSSQSTYSGRTIVDGGQLIVTGSSVGNNVSGPFGTGTLVFDSNGNGIPVPVLGAAITGITSTYKTDPVASGVTIANPVQMFSANWTENGIPQVGANTISGLPFSAANNLTLSGTMTVTGTNRIAIGAGQGSTTNGPAGLIISGTITGSGQLGVFGGVNNQNQLVDAVYITGNNTGWTGGWVQSNGSVATIIGNSNALGTGEVIMNGGIIMDDGKAVYNLANNMRFDGGTTFYVGNQAGTSTPNSMTLSGVLTGGGAMTLLGTGTLNLTNIDARTGSTTVSGGTLDVKGGGTQILTSSVTINTGGTYNIDNVGTDATTNNAHRLGDGVVINLQGGTLNFLGNSQPGASTNESLNIVNVNPGNSTINSVVGTATGDANLLNIGVLTHTSGGQLAFVGVGTALSSNFSGPGANQIVINNNRGSGAVLAGGVIDNVLLNGIIDNEPVIPGSAGTVNLSFGVSPYIGPTSVSGGYILPWATVLSAPSLGATPTTYDFTGITGPSVNSTTPFGPYSIAAFGGYVNESISAAASANDVVKLTANDNVTSNKTVAGVLVSGNNITVSGSGTVILNTGVLLQSGSGGSWNPNISITAPAFVGTPEQPLYATQGFILTGPGSSLEIKGIIQNGSAPSVSQQTVPMVFGGLGTLTLSGTNTYATLQPNSGNPAINTEIEGGTVIINNNQAFGLDSTATAKLVVSNTHTNSVRVFSGILQTGASVGGYSINNPIALNMGASAIPGDFLLGQGLALQLNNTNPLTLGGIISGNGNLALSTTGGVTPSVTLTGTTSNNFSGYTFVNGGTLTLAMNTNVKAFGTGPVLINAGTVQENFIGNPGSTQTDMFNGSNGVSLQVTGNGTLSMANNTIGTFDNIVFVNGGTINTGTGTLSLVQSLATLSTNASPSTASITGNLSLGGAINGGVGTFGAGATTLAHIMDTAKSGAASDLTITGQILGLNAVDGMVKTNTGTMTIGGSSVTGNASLTGEVAVNNGVLNIAETNTVPGYGGAMVVENTGFNPNIVNTPSTLNVTTNFAGQLNPLGQLVINPGAKVDISGTAGALTTVGSLDVRGATLSTGTGTLTMAGPLTALSTVGTSSVVSGNLSFGAVRQLVYAADAADGTPALNLTAQLAGTGSGGFLKQGTGTVVLANSVSNSYPGLTNVNEGTLVLSATGGNIAIPGNLIVGDFIGGSGTSNAAKADVVRATASNEIAPSSIVTVNNSGLLNLNNFNQTLSQTLAPGLVLSGGYVSTGTGTLTVQTTVQSKANTANQGGAVVSGKVALSSTGAPATGWPIDVQPAVVPLGGPDMTISAAISGPVGILKGGSANSGGTLALTANDTYSGVTNVTAGSLQVDGTLTLSTVTVTANQSTGGVQGSAVLSGTGILGNVRVTNGGEINPGDAGNGIGILTTNTLDLSASGTGTPQPGVLGINVAITGPTHTPGGNFDQINVATNVTTITTTTPVIIDETGETAGTGTSALNVVTWPTKGSTFNLTNVSVINSAGFDPTVIDPPGTLSVFMSQPANHFVITAPASAAAGSVVTYTVLAEDSFNNQDFSYNGTVAFSGGGAGATLPGSGVLTTGAGVFSATLVTAGNQTITATDAPHSLTGTSASILVTAGTLNHMSVVYNPSSTTQTTAGHLLGISVFAQDQFNNTVTTYSGTVHYSSNDPNAVLPDNSTLVSGVGTPGVLFETAGTRSITATDIATSSTGTSPNLTVVAGALNQFGIALPQFFPTGVQQVITVTAQDQFGNTVTTYAGTVALTSSDGGASFNPQSGQLTGGVGTFGATLATLGSQFISAHDSTTPSITGSNSAIVTAGVLNHFKISAPSSITAGGPLPYTIQAVDINNNQLISFSGTVSISTSDTLASSTGTVQLSGVLTSGIGVFAAVLKTKGNQTISAQAGTTSGTSSNIAVANQAANHLVVTNPALNTFASMGSAYITSQNPSPVTTFANTSNSGPSVVYTVLAEDQFGNIDANYAGTVHFATTDPSATKPSDSTLVSGQGVFSTSLSTAGNQFITASDTVTTSITGTSAPIPTRGLVVTGFTPTPTGFVVTFNKPFNPGTVSIYTQTGVPDDIMLATSGSQVSVHGTAVFNNPTQPTQLTFVKTAPIAAIGTYSPATGLLAAGNYTVTLRSLASGNGFQDLLGGALDGKDTAVPNNYIFTFSVAAPPTAVGIPDFARGPSNTDQLFIPTTVGNGGTFNLVYTNPAVTPNTGTVNVTMSTTGATLQSNLQAALNSLPQISTTAGAPNAVVVVTNPPTLATAGGFVRITFQNGLVAATNQLLSGTNGATVTLANIDVSNAIQNNGIPVALSSGLNVLSGQFVLQYNSNLLNITGGVNKIAVGGSTFTVVTNTSIATASTATISFSSPTKISATATSITLGALQATVPLGVTATYGAKQLLHFTSMTLTGTAGAITVTNQDAVEIAAFFGDVTDTGTPFSLADVNAISAVAGLSPSTPLQTIPGFTQFADADPVIIGDVALQNLGGINSTDASKMNQQLTAAQTSIPFLPSGLTITIQGPDPVLSVPTNLVASAGGSLMVPVNIDTARPDGSTGMTDAILALNYDPKVFDISAADIQLGSLPNGGTGWQLKADVNAASGLIGVELYSNSPIQTTAGGSLITINMHVRDGAPAGASGLTIVPFVGSTNGVRVYETSVSDAQGLFTLHPAQTALGTEPGAPGSVMISANAVVDGGTFQVATAPLSAPTSAGSFDVQSSATAAANTLALSLVEQVLGNMEETVKVVQDAAVIQPGVLVNTESNDQAHNGIRDLALLQTPLAFGQSGEWLPDDFLTHLSHAPKQVDADMAAEESDLAGLDAYFADEAGSFKLS